MAATRLIALHVNKGKTVAQCLADRTDYSENAAKTDDGKYISSYACDSKTCDEEFLLSKRQYEHITGRTQKRDVIAYQIRQSFKPGEITPEDANRIGYELAMRWTKGKHAFIVATHIDKAHIHNHIIYNSTSIDCTRKFRDFHLSNLALHRLSDMICLENQYSVITPKPFGERVKRTEFPQRKSFRDEICEVIDEAILKKVGSFKELLKFLEDAGYEIKRGQNVAVRGKGQKRFIRFRSLGTAYSETVLDSVIKGSKLHQSKFANMKKDSSSKQRHSKPGLSLLIDLQEKLAEGKNYSRIWVDNHNVKQMAEAMMFMSEHGFKNYEELCEKTDSITNRCDTLMESIKTDEARLQEIAVLKKHILNYSKSKDVFAEYKKSGYSKKFFEEHREVLTLRTAAKNAFDEYKKQNGEDAMLPSLKQLNAEYAEVLSRKKKAYSEYRKLKNQSRDFYIAKRIVEDILGIKEQEKVERQREEQEKNNDR